MYSKTYTNIDFNNKTVLITGGAGFIGSNLAFYFQNNFPNCEVIIFDSFQNEEKFSNGNKKSYGHFFNLLGFKGKIICGNINSKQSLAYLDKYSFDYIFHHAAISDTRVYDQEAVFETNINSFYYFINLALKNSSYLVYASSAALYGSLESPQKIGKEKPENPYAYSKYSMDQIAEDFSRKFPDLNIVGLRFFNVYGAREFFKEKTSSMVIQLAHQILNNKKPRLFFGSEKIYRDFIYIEDVIQANIRACSAKKNGVYNIGTGIPRSFKDIADILLKELNSDLSIEFFENPYIDYQTHTRADISLSEKYLGFNPNFSLEEGINDYLPEIINYHKLCL